MTDIKPIDLSDAQVQFFQANGFVEIGQISTAQELDWVGEIYDAIITREHGCAPGVINREDGREDGAEPPRALVKIMSPEHMAPALKLTSLLCQARQAATRLLGVDDTALRCGWRFFLKPAHGGETPWHQDAAYRPPPHDGVNIWMPLDPATPDNGCMQYIGGSHRGGIRPHIEEGNRLVAMGVDTSHSVECPLAPGEAIAHHFRTLHGARPNQTSRPRRALVVVCQVASNE